MCENCTQNDDKFKVFDHKLGANLFKFNYTLYDQNGEVELFNLMGDDLYVCQTASISYDHKIYSDIIEEINEETKANKLYDFLFMLLKNGHTSPFEHCEISFEMKLPVFVARQLIRHRTANVNERSARYTKVQPEFFKITDERLKKYNYSSPDEKRQIMEEIYAHTEKTFELYNKAVQSGIPKELARIYLPLAMYTKWYFKLDLNNLLKFFKQRLTTHAQFETRDYALKMFSIFSYHFPIIAAAFYVLNKQELSIPKTLVQINV